MKTKIGLSENCRERLSSIKGLFLTRVNKVFITLLLGLLFMSGIKAQTIMSFQSAMQTLEPAAAANLQSLVTDLHPTAYLTQGEITTYGEGAPVVAICDAASVYLLYGNNPTLSQVELINVTANSASELPSSIDLTQLEGLADLKYLFVVFAYDACGGSADGCLASVLEEIIQGTSSRITVIYNLSIPQ
jgi:hypothetical protein